MSIHLILFFLRTCPNSLLFFHSHPERNDLQKESKTKATKPLAEETPLANKDPRKSKKENNQSNEPKNSNNEADNIAKTDKKAKDWGRASNDPRNKS